MRRTWRSTGRGGKGYHIKTADLTELAAIYAATTNVRAIERKGGKDDGLIHEEKYFSTAGALDAPTIESTLRTHKSLATGTTIYDILDESGGKRSPYLC